MYNFVLGGGKDIRGNSSADADRRISICKNGDSLSTTRRKGSLKELSRKDHDRRVFLLIPCLLVSSAHNLCQQIGFRSGPTSRRA